MYLCAPLSFFFNHYNHTELFQYSLVPNRLPQGFKAELSQGDFISCSKGKSVLSTIPEQIDIEEVEEDASGLLPCPVDGCVCTYQSFRNLERHLLVGKCKMIPEKHTLLDAAKLSYVKKVEEGTSAQPTLAPTTSEVSPEAPLVQGWALRGAKKTVRFNENQRQCLEIGQESRHKAYPEMVSRDMRYARTEKGQRRFTVDEFLSAQQIQGHFFRAAAKLRHATASQSGREVTKAMYRRFKTKNHIHWPVPLS